MNLDSRSSALAFALIKRLNAGNKAPSILASTARIATTAAIFNAKGAKKISILEKPVAAKAAMPPAVARADLSTTIAPALLRATAVLIPISLVNIAVFIENAPVAAVAPPVTAACVAVALVATVIAVAFAAVTAVDLAFTFESTTIKAVEEAWATSVFLRDFANCSVPKPKLSSKSPASLATDWKIENPGIKFERRLPAEFAALPTLLN